MRNKLKMMVLIVAASAVGYSTVTLAADAPNGDMHRTMQAQPFQYNGPPVNYVKQKDYQKNYSHKMKWNRKPCRGPWNLGLNSNKHLSIADARTITEAALLMRGRHDLHIGTIQPIPMQAFDRPMAPPSMNARKLPQFYYITVINDKNRVVSRVVMNSGTGTIRPLHMKSMMPPQQNR